MRPYNWIHALYVLLKVLEKIRHRSAPPRRKIVSSTSYINQEAECGQERSPAVTLLNPVTVSMLSQQTNLRPFEADQTLPTYKTSTQRKSAATFAREVIINITENTDILLLLLSIMTTTEYIVTMIHIINITVRIKYLLNGLSSKIMEYLNNHTSKCDVVRGLSSSVEIT